MKKKLINNISIGIDIKCKYQSDKIINIKN